MTIKNEQMPDVIYTNGVGIGPQEAGYYEPYLRKSHVEATTVPKTEYNDAIYQRDLAKRDRNTADNRYAKLLASSVPRDKEKALIAVVERQRVGIFDVGEVRRALEAVKQAMC